MGEQGHANMAGRMSMASATQLGQGENSLEIAGVVVVQHDVLGITDVPVTVVEMPSRNIVVIDVVSPQTIKTGPSGVSMESMALYTWAGIMKDGVFPQAVTNTVSSLQTIKYHAYEEGDKKVIHVAGPDWRLNRPTEEQAVSQLTMVYTNVFRLFCTTGELQLCLRPISH